MNRSGRPSLIALDAVAVGVFAVIGRTGHDEAAAIGGVLATAAPFLAGGLIGAVVARSWRAPLSWRSGLLTWAGATGIGLALRFALEHRLPPTFVAVTAVSLAVLVLGWRGVAHLIARTGRRGPRRVRA